MLVYEEFAIEPQPKHVFLGGSQIDVPEAILLPGGLLIHSVKHVLGQHGAQLFHQSVQLELVPEPEDRKTQYHMVLTRTADGMSRSFCVDTQVLMQ